MQISDESQAHFSIYRTEVGSFAIGDALDDEQLFDLCRDEGDAFASLKLVVSNTSAQRVAAASIPRTPARLGV